MDTADIAHASTLSDDLMPDPLPTTDMGFCPYCQTFYDEFTQMLQDNKQNDRHPIMRPHHPNLASIRGSIARYRCKLCYLFYQYIVDHNVVDTKSPDTAGWLSSHHGQYLQPVPGYEGCRLLNLWFGAKFIARLYVLEETNSDRHGNNTIVGIGIVRDYEAEPPWYSTVRLIKVWLENCRKTHEECKKLKLVSMPTRLLRISDDAKHINIQENVLSGTPYATLSHCWGKLKILRLLKETKDEFERSISLSKLCKTFQDAILVAHSVGLQYIWIDSLCIIQDDEQDWLKESALMCSVYGESSLNLAAASALDGRGGLFLDRPSRPSRADLNSMTVNLNGQSRRFRFLDAQTYNRCISLQPLASRCWTLQERVLPTRTVNFSKSELLWQCKEQDACEAFPDRLLQPGDIITGYIDKAKPLDWSMIVEIYTNANLTNPRDKLIAISGIAQHIQRTTKDRYLAGLWYNGLVNTILWVLSPADGIRHALRTRPERYRAPTWSWASTDGRISFPNAEPIFLVEHLYVSILDCLVQTVTDNQFGEVIGGVLTLSCEILLSCKFHDPQCKDAGGLQTATVGGYTLPCLVYWDILLPELTGRQFYFLPVEKHRHDTKHFFPVAIQGLVLRQTGKECGQYERVGRFGTPENSELVPDDCEVTPELIRRIELSISGTKLEEKLYAEMHEDAEGKQRYAIDIV